MNTKLTYETKCRKCGNITQWYFGDSEYMEWSMFAASMNDHVKFPRLMLCTSCNKSTVQDVVSYTEPYTSTE